MSALDEYYLRMMIYGQPGSGKSRLAATAALDERLAPCLFLEHFGNPIAFRNYEKKPDVVTVYQMSDFNGPYEWFYEGQPADHPFCKSHNLRPPYKTLVIDSLTEVQRFVTRRVTGVEAAMAPGDLAPALGRQGFGSLLGTMMNWAAFYIQLPMNVVLISHEQQLSETVKQIRPLIWGQSGNEIAGFCYIVGRLVKGSAGEAWWRTWPTDPLTDMTQNVMVFSETPKYYAKEQYGLPVDHICDPTMTKVADLIEQSG